MKPKGIRESRLQINLKPPSKPGVFLVWAGIWLFGLATGNSFRARIRGRLLTLKLVGKYNFPHWMINAA
ncbi:hypothetical protein AWM70_22125 [Paenibacillus yonginensis]|uniref:Uncharacterized protein n=1 Tax=Paenibacillus yonginensis TaxID=1462996 RepID=A0A1B1N692_9BACL|nr:hypothetical protein AWM70_22125 [Paenibacillus yonginensis]